MGASPLSFPIKSLHRDSSPEVRDLTLQTAELLEGLGHRVSPLDHNPVPRSFVDDFVLYWAFLALTIVRTGQRTLGQKIDRDRLDNLTLGLDRHASRGLHRLPLAILRLNRLRRVTERFYGDYDVLLTPTLTDETPRIGHLDPTADYQQIIDRLSEWVGFTPLQNVTGEPAISLPLAQSASGLPVGMMFGAAAGQEATLLELAFELEQEIGWPTLAAR